MPMNANEIVKALREAPNYNAGIGTSTIEDEAADLILECRHTIGSLRRENMELRGQIESLTAQLADKTALLEATIAGQETLQRALAESHRRERAAVEDLGIIKDCQVCQRDDDGTCGDYEGCNFLWRGPQEAGKNNR